MCVSMCLCVKVQLSITTYKDSILTHEDRHTDTLTHTQWRSPPDATVTVTERIHLSAVIRLHRVINNVTHSLPQMYPDTDGVTHISVTPDGITHTTLLFYIYGIYCTPCCLPCFDGLCRLSTWAELLHCLTSAKLKLNHHGGYTEYPLC